MLRNGWACPFRKMRKGDGGTPSLPDPSAYPKKVETLYRCERESHRGERFLSVANPAGWGSFAGMEREYEWDEAETGSSYQPPEGDHFGRFVLLAVVLAVGLHGVALFFLGKVPFAVRIKEAWEWTTKNVTLEEPVLVMPEGAEEPTEIEVEEVAPPEDASELMADIDDILPELKDTEIDISPAIEEPEIEIKMEVPALEGEGIDDLLEPTKGPDLAVDLEKLGSSEEAFREAAEGQVVIDEGASLSDVLDPDEFNDSLLKKGARGAEREGDDGGLHAARRPPADAGGEAGAQQGDDRQRSPLRV